MGNKSRKKSSRSLIQRIVSWPHLAAAIVTAVIFLIGGFFFGSTRLLAVLTEDLTTTITAATESLEISLRDESESSWVLPAGEFLVPVAMKRDIRCNELELLYGQIPQGFSCSTDRNVRLVVQGAAAIRWDVTPDGNLSVRVRANGDPEFRATLHDTDDAELLATSEELRFTTLLGDDRGGAARSLRLPLIASTAVLGSHVRYSSSVAGSQNDFWQPTLLAGHVVTFGKNRPDKGKYHILSEQLDSGDVVYVDADDEAADKPNQSSSTAPEEATEPPEEDSEKDTIWGVATVEQRAVAVSETTEVEQYLIHAVLHTTHRALTVRRFGSTEGHTIKASNWSIMSKWPNGQKTWVFFVSVTVVLAFALQLSDWIASKANKSKKN